MSGTELIAAVLGGVHLVNTLIDQFSGELISKPTDVIASFVELQRTQVLQIQIEIINLSVEIETRQRSPDGVPQEAMSALLTKRGDALQRYAQALRDYETLGQEALQYNPFESPKWHAHVPKRLQPLLAPPLTPYAEIAPYASTVKLRELDKKARMFREKKHAALERLFLGTFGGIMLIAPMLIMVLKYNRTTTLVTTSVATMLFVFALASFARGMAGKDVLATVAAYAAVFVVFVGTSIAPLTGAQ